MRPENPGRPSACGHDDIKMFGMGPRGSKDSAIGNFPHQNPK
jgi:hypothetical protein